MFHTIGYKGHYIHLSYLDKVEKIRTQIVSTDGGLDLQERRTFIGAKRAITRHVKTTAARAHAA
jgi:hypothetical protein